MSSSAIRFPCAELVDARPKAWHDGVGQRHLRPNRTVVVRARRCHLGGIPVVLGCPLAAAAKGATMAYEGMIAETVSVPGDKHQPISAYLARPLGPGPFPGMVLLHHMPGWDEWYFEATRKFAHHGYATLCPNLYHRAGEGTADDVA